MLRRIVPLFALCTLVASGVSAQSSSKALAIPYNDAKVQWGACPDFLPKGCGLGVLNGDPAKPNADVFFRLMAGSPLPHHYHTSAERMVLVSGELHITYDGQDPVVLRPGMYAYGPAKLAHKGRCAEGAPCVLFIAFEGPVDAIPTGK